MLLNKMREYDSPETDFDILFSKNTAIVVMAGNKEQQGKILKTNQGIFNVFDYNVFEVQS